MKYCPPKISILLTRAKQRGSALIFILAVTSIVSSIIILFSKTINNHIAIAKALNHNLQISSQTHNNLVTNINSLVQKIYNNSDNILTDSQIINIGSPATIFKISENNLSKLIIARQTRNVEPRYKLPNFTSLKSTFTNYDCPVDSAAQNNDSALETKSIWTCIFNDQTVQSGFYNGNIKGDKMVLSTNAAADSQTNIIVIGNLDIQEILIDNPKDIENFKVILFVVGKIKIHSVELMNKTTATNQNITMDIISSSSDIEIKTLPATIKTCSRANTVTINNVKVPSCLDREQNNQYTDGIFVL